MSNTDRKILIEFYETGNLRKCINRVLFSGIRCVEKNLQKKLKIGECTRLTIWEAFIKFFLLKTSTRVTQEGYFAIVLRRRLKATTLSSREMEIWHILSKVHKESFRALSNKRRTF